jgi:uncharacterized protein
MARLTPVAPHERLVTLDVLRGFALFGVLIGNLYHLYNGGFANRQPPQGTAEAIGHWFIVVAIQSKAQTLLTLLFGFGFAAQLIRASEGGKPVLGVYTRRLLVLLGLGILHVALLWWGDVLWTYAIAGFGLLLFHRASNRTRVIAALILMFVPPAIYRLPGVWLHIFELTLDPANLRLYNEQVLAAMYGSDYFVVMKEHIQFAWIWSAGSWPQYLSWILGHFLLGYVAGTLRWFDRDGADRLATFRKLLFAGLACGAAGTAMVVAMNAGVFFRPGLAVQIGGGVLVELHYVGLAVAFVAAVVLLAQGPRWRHVLALLVPVGRMPLTTYFTQSLICTFLLYGWGLGWIAWISPVGCIGLAFAIFAVQLGLAHWWLHYFRFGPLEWIWRSVVYLRRPPMRV